MTDRPGTANGGFVCQPGEIDGGCSGVGRNFRLGN